MKFWIAPILIGLVIGVVVVIAFPHHPGIMPLALRRGGPVIAPAPAPTIGTGFKVTAIVAGTILAFIPNDAVKKIGVTLATAGITSLFGSAVT